MIINSKELLKEAAKGGYAVPAFNIDNLESAIAVVNAVKKLKTPVIIQMIPRTLAYGGIPTYPAMLKALLENVDIPVVIHLDHGNMEVLEKAVSAGFSSVMYDGSALPLNENIDNTIKARLIASELSLEGELGSIGGKEESDFEGKSAYTDVNEATLFVEKTKVDSLAIGVGTVHGLYRGEPKINQKRIAELNEALDVPLVLHGATGLPDETVRAAIKNGIAKINFATELRLTFTHSLKKVLESETSFDPKAYFPEVIKAVQEAVERKIQLCYNL